MPSPTSITRPTSRTSMRDSYCSISCRITEAISSALNFMGTPVHHLLTDDLQLVGDRVVINGVAQAKHRAADELGFDGQFQNRLAFELGAQGDADAAGQFGA